MTPSPILASLQVGLPRRHGRDDAADPLDRPWESGFFKDPVPGPVALSRTNLAGDGQADLANHGGPDKAVLAYAEAHYLDWRRERPGHAFPPGAFGENLTIRGLDESTVCLGDTYAIGDALLQVSQPRAPCWKLARRNRIVDLTERVRATGRTGWYLRVLREGTLQAGDAVRLVARPRPEWPVLRATRAMNARRVEREEALALAAVPELSEAWRHSLTSVSTE